MTQKKSSQARNIATTSRERTVLRSAVTGQFLTTLKGERLPSRDAKSGSFTTERSRAAIKSNVDTFTPALERLAKK